MVNIKAHAKPNSTSIPPPPKISPIYPTTFTPPIPKTLVKNINNSMDIRNNLLKHRHKHK